MLKSARHLGSRWAWHLNQKMPPVIAEQLYQWCAPSWGQRAVDPVRVEGFIRVFDHVLQLNRRGDYLEFGVYDGTSLKLAYREIRLRKLNMRLFGFDGFQGLPEADGAHRKGSCFCPRPLLERNIRAAGVNINKITIIEGLYSQSLTQEVRVQHQLNSAALVHINCDLYSSTCDVLTFIEDIVGPGTVILFDDWRVFDEIVGEDQASQYGYQKAFAEWSRSQFFRPLFEFGGRMVFVHG